MRSAKLQSTATVFLMLSALALLISCGNESGGSGAAAKPGRVRATTPEGAPLLDMINSLEAEVGRLEEAQKSGRNARLDDSRTFSFDLTGAPSRGTEDASLVMVVFSDFECPFCSRFAQTSAALVEKFPDDLRLVFMQFPLQDECNAAITRPFHRNACIAAEASLAAAEQGKFWEMHDKIFENQKSISVDSLVDMAVSLGLDGDQVRSAIEGEKYKELIMAQARQLEPTGRRGTPTVFINGMLVQNVRWDDAGTAVEFISGLLAGEEEGSDAIAPAVEKPDALPASEVVLEDGTLLEQRLAAILERLEAIDLSSGQRKAPERRRGPDPEKTYQIEINDSPVRGPADAPVTIVEFSDFTCPYCEKGANTLEQIRKKYPRQVKIVFKNVPNQRHRFSLESHMAAAAAKAQGKFWEMYDKIFENRTKLTPELLRELAQEVGLNMEQYDAFIENTENRQALVADLQQASSANVSATPTIFINGKYQQNVDEQAMVEVIDSILKEGKGD